MSREDYERLCSELDNTRHKDHPKEYDTLSSAEKAVIQYWIAHAIQPAKKADDRHSSYGLKHDYARETKLYVSHAQFKGAMLVAGYLPTDKGEQSWHFMIKPLIGGAGQDKVSYQTSVQGGQDPQMLALVQEVRTTQGGNSDTFSVMI